MTARFDALTDRLRIPLIAAPMLRVSGPELVSAVCGSGVIGAFPTINARSADGLDAWLSAMELAHPDGAAAPHCPNLVIRQPQLREHLDVLLDHRVEVVITSVGSPAPVIGPLHAAGTLVLSDVATLAHARKAVDAGADGLVLLTAGAGGQTGWLNPLAFVRAVREFFDGPLVVAGGIADGHALAAVIALGADLGYMGTAFLACEENLAPTAYRDMVVESSIDDVVLTRAFTGLPANMLRPSILAAGLDPDALDEQATPPGAQERYGPGATGPRRWETIWSAGHSVSGVRSVRPATAVVEQVAREYDAALDAVRGLAARAERAPRPGRPEGLTPGDRTR